MGDVGQGKSVGVGPLQDIAKEHEDKLVVDRSLDRLIKWIGVYLLASLAVVVKFVEITEQKVRCYPLNKTTHVDRDFISFAASYCWGTESIGSDCILQNAILDSNVFRNPQLFRWVNVLLPYLLLLQATCFAIPWVWWHFKHGAQLLGHMKFFQQLLKNILLRLQEREKLDFNGNMAFKDDPQQALRKRKRRSNWCGCLSRKSSEHIDEDSEERIELTQSGDKGDEKREKAFGCCEKFLVGEYLTDKHFLSYLCYENMASFESYLYVLTVGSVKKQEFNPGVSNENPRPQNYIVTILKEWCNNNDFKNIKFLKAYVIKQISTAVMGLIFTILISVFLWFAVWDLLHADIFGCQLPYEDACMLCSVPHKKDMFAVSVCNGIFTLVILVLSMVNWLRIRGCSLCGTKAIVEKARCFEKLEKIADDLSNLISDEN